MTVIVIQMIHNLLLVLSAIILRLNKLLSKIFMKIFYLGLTSKIGLKNVLSKYQHSENKA